MSNVPSFEIAMKKYILGTCWEDAELYSEAVQDLLEFPDDMLKMVPNPAAHPIAKSLRDEQEAAEKTGTEEELFRQWESEVLPYIRYRQK